jgi:uncharacterized protein YndB with AHSA1/START domain
MSRWLALMLLLSAGGNVGAPQHSARPVAPQGAGPVEVTRSATMQVFIESDAVSIFSYLSEQGKLSAWFADQAILEPRFGGKYHLRWKNQDPVDGVVTELTAAKTLALTWKHPSDDAETRIRFRLSPQGGRTLVQLEHQGFSSAANLDKAVKFWVFYLQNLKSVIETQVDLRQTAAKAARSRPK